MSLYSRVAGGIAALFRNEHVERDLDDELQSFLDLAVERKMADGMTRGDAVRAARLELGGVEAVKDGTRDVGWESIVDSFWQDVRYAVRTLAKARGFTIVAVLSLAIAIGANASVFTFLDALLLRSLPIADPDRLVEVRPRTRSFDPAVGAILISFPMYLDLRAGQEVFTEIAAAQGIRLMRATVSSASGERVEIDNVGVAGASGTYFNVLGLQPAAGHFFRPDDDRDAESSETKGSVVVPSDAFWDRQFGRDPTIVGQTILLDRSPARVIGIAPRGFTGERVGSAPDVWVPIVPFNARANLEGRRGTFTSEIARLRPGVSLEQAEAAMTLLFQRLLKAEGIVQGDLTKYGIALQPAGAGIDSGIRRRYVTPLEIVMAIVVLVLLIASANIANLLIARAGKRSGEIGVRLAIGCSRSRLVRQLLTESLVLSILGALGGLAVAYASTRSLLRMVDTGPIPVALDLTPNLRVLLFLTNTTLTTAFVFGLVPALRASGMNPLPALQRAGRSAGIEGKQGLGRWLVAGQVAITLLLLIGAVLLIESFRNLHGIDWGFRPEQVVVFDLQHNARDRQPAALVRVATEIQRRVSGLPGVESASVSWILLFTTTDQRRPLLIPGYTPPPDERERFRFIGENITMVRFNAVSPTYFKTVGMTLVAGRGLEETDGASAPRVAVINEAMARRYFGRADPIGRTFGMVTPPSGSVPTQIVGMVRDAKFNNLREETMPMLYVPIAQEPRTLRGLEVRTRGPLSAVVGPIRRAIAEVTKDIMIQRVLPLSEQVDRTLSVDALMMRLLSVFGGIALLLACIGLYGVLAYQVAQRTPEFGIRLALGATRSEIVRLVLRETTGVVLVGVGVGLALAFVSTRLLSSFLYGLSPTDPLTMTIAVLIFAGCAALASYLPSRRAAAVDPNVALRYE